jgi:hypothetical protein
MNKNIFFKNGGQEGKQGLRPVGWGGYEERV